MSNHSHFSVLSPLEFLEDVAQQAKHAKFRVWGQAMDVEPGKTTDEFLAIFEMAGQRDIDTRLHADHYSLMVTDSIFNYWPFVSRRFKKHRDRQLHDKEIMATYLRSAGVRFFYTNPPSLLDKAFPARGRNHMKIVIIDNIAWIGGVNFSDPSFAFQDVMIRIEEVAIVNEIAYIFELVDEQKVLRDMAITCTDDTTLLVDGGKINRSIILRNAVEMINAAERNIQVISPLIPDAALLHALGRAIKSGKNVSIIAPRVEKMSGIYFLVDKFNELLVTLRGITLPIIYKPFMIHAKILIVDDNEVIVGSHNLSSRGVRMGTEEIALRSTNKTLVSNLTSFYQKLAELQKVEK